MMPNMILKVIFECSVEFFKVFVFCFLSFGPFESIGFFIEKMKEKPEKYHINKIQKCPTNPSKTLENPDTLLKKK